MMPFNPSDIHAIWISLLADVLWVICTLFFSAVVGVYIRDRGAFAGHWSMTITWEPRYAEYLFGQQVNAPHSVGEIALTYSAGRKNCYWGMGYFELRDSTQQYAQLCVEFKNILVGYKIFNSELPFLFARKLRSFDLHSLLREKTKDFNYAPWVQYRMVFKTSCADRLEGDMILMEGDMSLMKTGKCVGTIVATRTT